MAPHRHREQAKTGPLRGPYHARVISELTPFLPPRDGGYYGCGTQPHIGGKAMQGTLGRVVLGFIAAVISVLIVHQTIVYVLGLYGMSRSVPWSMRPLGYGPFPWVPTVANVAFWGGLWGILFALIYKW